MTTDLALADPLSDADYARMAQAIAFLSHHYRRQPTLDEAAREAGLSPHHFQRTFQRWAGVSPKKFVQFLTLEHARRLLDGEASVLDAAYDSGLSGPSRLHDLTLSIEAMTPGELKAKGKGLDIAYGFHPSPFGNALAMLTDRGLCGLAFADKGEEDAALADMQSRWPLAHYRKDAAQARAAVTRIFERDGKQPLFLIGTPWQVKVWEALLRIPEGRITTYETIAREVCTERATRAVGTAVGRNPISWLIPCHRVLRKSGALAGYHWGLDRKRAMLAFEAARTSAP